MTTTYDPQHPSYFDEGDLRGELTRVFDLCHGCRLCFNLCPSFPTLFEFVDQHDGLAERMSRQEQNQVIDECYQCKLCYVKCPYVPPHEWNLDFPRLIMRANAIRARNTSIKDKITDSALGNTDLAGKFSTLVSPIVNSIMTGTGTPLRKVIEKTIGISSKRALPTYARRRFSKWFKETKRLSSSKLTSNGPGGAGSNPPQASVSVYPTCFIEYMAPEIGEDLVKVFEHNNIECSMPQGARCCGAPWLHSGAIDKFVKVAEKNIEALEDDLRQGKDIVVAQPTCAYVIKKDYPMYVKSELASLVAEKVFEPSEYLFKIHKGADTQLNTNFEGSVPPKIVYHVACHHQALNTGIKARDLLKLAGVSVAIVPKCSGIDGTWGYRAANYEESIKVGKLLFNALSEELDKVDEVGENVIMGDCHLANCAIAESNNVMPLHPIQVLARAYGLTHDE